MQTQTIETFIPHERQGEYFTLPFEMPAGTAAMQLHYAYPRGIVQQIPLPYGTFTPRPTGNTIDLGLVAPDGSQVGSSGSDKLSFILSAARATPGYTPRPLTPGTWQILVGAYKVLPQGVNVTYHLTFSADEEALQDEPAAGSLLQEDSPAVTPPLALYLGDLHTHTIGSDGILTAHELALHARAHGLHFLAITDHNQMSRADSLPQVDGITLIPGVEWTHYQGHATFLGVDQPYDPPFFTNQVEEMTARFTSAQERGALISIAHPFEESCPFKLAMGSLPHDCIEVWNGPMRESNLRAIGFWLQLLAAGKHLPITAGSDYHRDALFQILGGPCMGVYAPSRSTSDLLNAIRKGHSFITFAPNGPTARMTCGDAMMGDRLAFKEGLTLHIEVEELKAGDEVLLLHQAGKQSLLTAPADGSCVLDVPFEKPGFAVLQVLRTFLPGVPPLPALLSNAMVVG